MVNESLTTKLARERLAALKQFIPLRNLVRDKLNQRQLAQSDFSAETEQLFSPITTATKEATAKTERAIWGDIPDLEKDPTKLPRKETPLLTAIEKIAEETEKTQQDIAELSENMQPRKSATATKKDPAQKLNELRARFNENALALIDKTPAENFPMLVVTTYENKITLLQPNQRNFIKDIEHWAKTFYKIKTKTSRIDHNSRSYRGYLAAVKKVNADYEEQLSQLPQQLKPQRQQPETEDDSDSSVFGDKSPQNLLSLYTIDTIRQFETDEELIKFTVDNFNKKKRDLYVQADKRNQVKTNDWVRLVYLTRYDLLRIPKNDPNYADFQLQVKALKDKLDLEQPKTGKGYHGNHQRGHQHQHQQTGVCPGNILGDISRLEVLIGGKRAGNNSPEIINEAADICRRLFTGGLMNINVYRELIEELAENHGGYHSD